MSEEGFNAADFYSCDKDGEELTAKSPEDAIDLYLGDLFDEMRPAELEVYAFRRNAVQEHDRAHYARSVVECFLESVDEDYGNPDEATEPDHGMLEAGKAFVDAALQFYVPWRCSCVGSRRMPVPVED